MNGKTSPWLYLLGIIPAVWLGLLIAPAVSGGLMEIVTQFPIMMENPLKITWCEDSLKTVLVFILAYASVIKMHTITLSNRNNLIKSEQIQPVFSYVTVSGDMDTDVIFTDTETGETYTIGYITQGIKEKIQLEKGKWYTVKGKGNLTIRPVNVRVE